MKVFTAHLEEQEDSEVDGGDDDDRDEELENTRKHGVPRMSDIYMINFLGKH